MEYTQGTPKQKIRIEETLNPRNTQQAETLTTTITQR
jgi:hypothetical protein